jgi:hypothetical protein
MKKLALLLLTFVSLSTAAFSADVAVNGKLTTWAGMDSNATDRNSKAADSKGYLYVAGELNTTVELADNVKVVMQLELNDKVSNGNTLNSSAATGRATVEIDEAYVEIKEFFMDMLTIKIGHQFMEYDLRGNHRAMLIAEDFTAIKGTFHFEGTNFLDVFYAKANESLTSHTAGSTDTDLFGVHVNWDFNENIHVIGYANYASIENLSTTDKGDAGIISVGAGVDYFLLDKALELFAEVAGEFGDVSKNVSQSAIGADLGARYTFKELGSIKGLYVELNLGYRSGVGKKTKTNEQFITNSARTGALIAEGGYNRSATLDDNPMYQGYVADSYMAIRFEAGANWTEKLSTHILFAYFDNTDDKAKPYGSEFDVCNVFKYSENVTMAAHIGIFMADKKGVLANTLGKADTVFALALETTVAF